VPWLRNENSWNEPLSIKLQFLGSWKPYWMGPIDKPTNFNPFVDPKHKITKGWGTKKKKKMCCWKVGEELNSIFHSVKSCFIFGSVVGGHNYRLKIFLPKRVGISSKKWCNACLCIRVFCCVLIKWWFLLMNIIYSELDMLNPFTQSPIYEVCLFHFLLIGWHCFVNYNIWLMLSLSTSLE